MSRPGDCLVGRNIVRAALASSVGWLYSESDRACGRRICVHCTCVARCLPALLFACVHASMDIDAKLPLSAWPRCFSRAFSSRVVLRTNVARLLAFLARSTWAGHKPAFKGGAKSAYGMQNDHLCHDAADVHPCAHCPQTCFTV